MTDSGRHERSAPQLRTESPYGETPEEDVACADCGKYSLMVGPVDFDGEVVEHGDFVCVPCALRRGVDLDQ